MKIEKANSMKTAYIIKVNDLLVIKLKTMRPCWWTKQLFSQSLHEKKEFMRESLLFLSTSIVMWR